MPICAGALNGKFRDSICENPGPVGDGSRETLESIGVPVRLRPMRDGLLIICPVPPYEVGGIGNANVAILGSVGGMGIIGIERMLASVGAKGIVCGMDDKP